MSTVPHQEASSAVQTIIAPPRRWSSIQINELWRYRELLYIFTWRDIKVRYKQTAIGILWAILQPILLMVVFSIFFGSLAKVPSNGVPYPVFVFSGLLFWNYFSTALTSSSNSLVDNENLIKKIYFPRLILPLSPALTPMIDFALSYVVLIGLMLAFHFQPSILGLLLMPILLFLVFLTASGLGIFLSAVNVKYRDVRFTLPFLVQSLLFITPVIYPVTLVPDRFRWLLALNPMTGIIEAGRASLIGQHPINLAYLGLSILIAFSIFLLSVMYFRKTEKFFADIV